MTAHTLTLSTWYADGLRWIGSLFVSAADALDRRNSSSLVTHAEHQRRRQIEEYLDDLRYRMQVGH